MKVREIFENLCSTVAESWGDRHADIDWHNNVRPDDGIKYILYSRDGKVLRRDLTAAAAADAIHRPDLIRRYGKGLYVRKG